MNSLLSMKSRMAALWAGVVLTLAVAAADSAKANFPEGADAFIRQVGDRAIETLTKPGMNRAEMEDRFREIFRDSFNVPAIGRFVLGKYWRVATPEERREFLLLFEEFVVRTYAKRFKDYTGETLQVDGIQPESDTQAIVNSAIVRPNAPPIRVEWRVGVPQNEEGFKIYDVTIEGVSMAVTQRAEFAAVIERSGGRIGGLITALREKIETLKSADAS